MILQSAMKKHNSNGNGNGNGSGDYNNNNPGKRKHKGKITFDDDGDDDDHDDHDEQMKLTGGSVRRNTPQNADGWASLRKKAVTLESILQSQLDLYGAIPIFVSRITHPKHSTEKRKQMVAEKQRECENLEREIDSLLSQTQETCEEMSRLLSSSSSSSSSSSLSSSSSREERGKGSHAHQLERLQTLLSTSKNDYLSLKQRIANSITKVNTSINTTPLDALEEGGGGEGGGGGGGNQNLLNREHSSLQTANQQANDAIQLAIFTSHSLESQGSRLKHTAGQMKSIEGELHASSTTVDGVRRMKQRDALVLSCVIASCLVFAFVYWLQKPA